MEIRVPLGPRAWPPKWPEPYRTDWSNAVVAADLVFLARRAVIRCCRTTQYHWVKALSYRVCQVVVGEPVKPWTRWREAERSPFSPDDPNFSELVALPFDEVVRGTAGLRVMFGWLNLRRRRLYHRPLPVYAYDTTFGAWLRTLDDTSVAAFAQRFLVDRRTDESLELSRSRLSLLRPMPLALLWPYHLYCCSTVDTLVGCESVEEVYFEYVSLFAAIHVCRALAEYQRTNRPIAQFGPWYWTPHSPKDEPWEDYVRRMVTHQVDLAALPESVVEKYVQLLADVSSDSEACSRQMTWRSVVGPSCPQCRKHVRGERPAFMALPPFSAGCTCEILFDPENDAFMEAPWQEGGSDMRLLLRAAEAAFSQTRLEVSEGHVQSLLEWLELQSRGGSRLSALLPRVAKAVSRAAAPRTPGVRVAGT